MYKLQSYKENGIIWICLSLILIFQTEDSFAGKKYNSNTGAKDLCSTVESLDGAVINDNCATVQVTNGSLTESGDVYILRVGVPIYGATSMTSAETTVPPNFNLVRKHISSDPAFGNGTLADGIPGMMLTIFITTVDGAGTFIVTPSRKTGFTTVTFDAAKDSVTLLYIDDMVGWILIAQNSVTVGIP